MTDPYQGGANGGDRPSPASAAAIANAATLRVVENAARAWRQTFDAVDFVLLTVDRFGHVQRVNRAALTLLGGRFEDWIGRPIVGFPAGQPWAAVKEMVDRLIDDGLPHTHQVEHGKVWELACTGFRRDDDFSVVWARDVTPMVELQRAVLRSEAMGAMGELLAGVAHEVRNPLFAITALLDAWGLQPGIQGTPIFEMLRHEVMRMRQLMEELLEYGRPFSALLTAGDLKPVADEAATILRQAAEARALTIEADVSGPVRMDQARLLRVFLNLLQNAIDHSPPGGHIHAYSRIRTDLTPQIIEISVRDHGPGFSEADLPRVFNPFFTRRPGGTGLGLPIVHRIVEEHGGTISVGNHADGGGLIRLQLPVAADLMSA
jgi:PAS domain S-box-containing protein